MNEELRIQPFGDEQYKILVMGRTDGSLSIFVNMAQRLLREYSTAAITTLTDLGYQGDQERLMQDIAVAWYAQVGCVPEVPRTVLWYDDSKEEVLTKLRDVICHQRWGQTITQDPKIQEIFPKLNFGIVAKDPIGYARGAAVRALIAASYNKETVPMVYFDQMRRYPSFARDLLKLLDGFNISDGDLDQFDPDFYLFMWERFEAASDVLGAKKPGAEPWEPWPLDENPIWQKYIDDWDNYQYWLAKKRGMADN